ncbi:MAG TPA: terminase family protein [Allosphingosinicella sp.]
MTLAFLAPAPGEALPIFFKSLIPPAPGRITRARALFLLGILGSLTRIERRAALTTLPPLALRAIREEWWWQVHDGQAEPEGDWRLWAIVAGRGFGKTRAGAEWVWARARDAPGARIALVAATLEEIERVMIRGESGLLAIARTHERPRWIPSRGVLLFPSGAEAHAFSAERPEKLRGPQHHYAWCDELAKWPNADATWNNLMLALRLGTQPRTIVTTTPKPVPLLRRILALPRAEQTKGRTDDNPHLPADFIAAMNDMFAGTRLARQELEGTLLDDFEDALWTRELIEKAREPDYFAQRRRDAESLEPGSRREAAFQSEAEADAASPGANEGHGPSAPLRLCATPPSFVRIVVGLDPPASTGGDSCGIVVCGKDEDGVAWVLADLTARGLSPEAWARRVAGAAQEWGQLYTGVPARVIAEKNQGGDMIASVLRAVDANLRVRLVPATKSKAARAEPIALRFETGRARLAGHFPELEDQLCALTWSGYQGPGSPDRLDAMVWAMTELFEKKALPRIRSL